MNLKTIATVAGIISALGLGGGITWAWDYHDQFVTVADADIYKEKEKRKDSLRNLDTNREHVLTRITMFQLHGLAKLSDEQKAEYNRTSARLISLQARRDAITSGSIN